MRNRPANLPSILSYKDTKADTNLLKNIKQLLTNKNFLILFFSYSILYANYSCLGAIVGPLTDAFKYNASNASFFGVAFIILGITGSFVHAIMLDKYKKFKKQFFIVGLTAFLAYFPLVGGLVSGSPTFATFTLGIFGFCLIPVIGVGASFISINHMPISPAASVGLANMGSAIVATLLSGIVSYFYTSTPDNPAPKSYKYIGIAVLIGSAGIGIVLSLFVKEKDHFGGSMRLSTANFSVSFTYEDPDVQKQRFEEARSLLHNSNFEMSIDED